MIWTQARKDRVEALWHGGARRDAIAAILTREFGEPVTSGAIAGLSTRMSLHVAPEPERVWVPALDHPAIAAGETLFPGQVVEPPVPSRRSVPNEGGHVLMSGGNQRKLGAAVTVGPWRGMPIFSLSLEERATCPSSCANWQSCFGNAMHLATRYRHGPALEAALEFELRDLQQRYPRGFVVRLHLLGDFYSVAYVARWANWLVRFPALRVFGYTARDWLEPIGAAVAELAFTRWDRFAVRLSSRESGTARAVTVWEIPAIRARPDPRVVICPAQLGRVRNCGTCGFCWLPKVRHKTVAFIAHGPLKPGRPKHA